MGQKKKSPFYCIFFERRFFAHVGTRFFLSLEEARQHARLRLKHHRVDEKAHIHRFHTILLPQDVHGLATSVGYKKVGKKLYLEVRVDFLELEELIERSQDELIALVERRMSKRG
jgi:hypothetical protein